VTRFISAWGHDALTVVRNGSSELGLVVIDEAHEFKEVLGGQTRELLRRMRTLRDVVIKDTNIFCFPYPASACDVGERNHPRARGIQQKTARTLTLYGMNGLRC